MTGDTIMPALVWCPFASAADARTAANVLLDEGLVACANILPAMETLYSWQGERGEGTEAGMLLKTNIVLLENVVARLLVIHPYVQPTIVGWQCDAASPATLGWLGGLGR